MIRIYQNCDIEYFSQLLENTVSAPKPMHEVLMSAWKATGGEYPRLIIDERIISHIEGQIGDHSFPVETHHSEYIATIDEGQAREASEVLRQKKWGYPDTFSINRAYEVGTNHCIALESEWFPFITYPEHRHTTELANMVTTVNGVDHYSWNSNPIKEQLIDDFKADYTCCLYLDISLVEVLHPETNWDPIIQSLGLETIMYDLESPQYGKKENKEDTVKLGIDKQRMAFFDGWLAGQGLTKEHEFKLNSSDLWNILSGLDKSIFRPSSTKSITRFFGFYPGISFPQGRPPKKDSKTSGDESI